MYLKKICVQNFRLWLDAEIELEKESTIIVGKNNAGKTSFMDLLDCMISDNKISFDDYPLCKRAELYENIKSYLKGEKDFQTLVECIHLPSIKLEIDYSLDSEDDSLGALSSFIIDTNEDVTSALIAISYSIVCTEKEFKALFQSEDLDSENFTDIMKNILSEKLHDIIKLNVFAVNPTDYTKKRKNTISELQNLIPIYKIQAERNLDENDDYAQRKISPLQSIMTNIFSSKIDDSLQTVQAKIEELKNLCKRTNSDSQNQINALLNEITKQSLQFGYPSAEDLKLEAKSNIELEKQIQSSVDLHYKDNSNNEFLPSSYNGLGYKNLIKIELKLIDFSNKIKLQIDRSIPLIFIEEPESHMHPQMQQKFIEYLDKFCGDTFSKKIQTIITTHSSHIVHSANFEKIRYLKKKTNTIDVKNLGHFELAEDCKKFLEKYLTLNKCDLFFADKVILIEGTAERLLIPDMISKLDQLGKFSQSNITLKAQYYALIEVGGAYAYQFIPLLRFLEIPSLIITDIDSVAENKNNRYNSCIVSLGTSTSNATIKHWFKSILSKQSFSFEEIKNLTDENKTSDNIHIEYQTKENNLCGRSLEEAIKNVNREPFSLTASCSEDDLAYNPTNDGSKTDFAMNLLFDLSKTNYIVPQYIEKGLVWLNSQCNGR